MSRINTDESDARAPQATKLLLKAEKKFFKHKFKQASTIRKKVYRLRLRKKAIAMQITMLNILEEEIRNSAGTFPCEKCGLFLDPNESLLHFCVAPENVSTPERATGNKRHLSSLAEQSSSANDTDIDFVTKKKKKEMSNEDPIITARLKYGDDEMATCMECGKTWDGFAQHRCLID